MFRPVLRAALGATTAVGAASAAAAQLDCGGDAAASLYSSVVMPLLRATTSAEVAHRVAVLAAHHGLTPMQHQKDPPSLRTTLWGRAVDNPIGLAAGFDKDGEAIAGLFGVGFGMVEVGSVTPLPQPGNPKPRVFRLPEDGAVINRYGFNSCGHEASATHIAAFRSGLAHPLTSLMQSRLAGSQRLLGINLGKNKTSPDAAADYAAGVRALARHADYLVVNVSSPNTPGLRGLQEKDELRTLLRAVRGALDALPAAECVGGRVPPLVLKVAPDLSKQQLGDIATVVLKERVDGVIVSNTTISREGLSNEEHRDEVGGLSGKPLFAKSTGVLAELYKRTGGKVTLIGAGGVSSGADAYAKIRAGASAVQLYTALAFEGPPLVPRVKRELAALLARDGYASVAEAIGADSRKGR